MAFCNKCGTPIADGATTCAACAGRVPVSPVGAPAQGMTDNVAGMLAYLFIPAIVFLVVEPYNKNRFIRFHSFQCLFLCVVMIAVQIGLSILTIVPFLVLLTLPLHAIVALGAFVLWIVMLLKANQGQMYKLPMIGDLAEKQANTF